MDRNSAIGLTLIAVLLLVYFYWFSPQPQPAAQRPADTETVDPTEKLPDVKPSPRAQTQNDSLLSATYGDLAAFATGSESISSIETNDIRVTFTSKGGIIKELELKNFKTYDQEPLKLITPERSTFNLFAAYQGKNIDLYSLYYEQESKKVGDTMVVSFTIRLDDGRSLTQVYTIPREGFQIGYSIVQSGFTGQLSTRDLVFRWNDVIPPMEKDLNDTRVNTTITFFTPEDGFDDLPERSTSTETKELTTPVNWVAIKQKFFLASIIAADRPFSGAGLSTSIPKADTIVKKAAIELTIPEKLLNEGKADFKFYVGPNDYQIIGDVTEGFDKNVYLGWPPVYWINKYIIFPVFHLLTQFIGNYGVIIIILVILLKLVLAPLSYRSYLSMAKMKVLKPELDEIKERHGDDMAKVQQEQLKLYQQVGVNPLSGCIPVLLQMPILFAMFYLFPASIELRQEPFLWAEDLSTYDSLIQLPFSIPFGVGSHISLFTLLMTASTLIYTWQNNQLSSVQGPMKSMSYIMPVVFFFVLNSFPAGLTFYYFVSNLVTFAQQAIIRRFVDEEKIKRILEENRRRNLAGGGKKSRFMAKLEDAMKASEEARRKAEEQRKRKK